MPVRRKCRGRITYSVNGQKWYQFHRIYRKLVGYFDKVDGIGTNFVRSRNTQFDPSSITTNIYENTKGLFTRVDFLFDFCRKLICGAIVPTPRSCCCTAACPNGKVLVWGGYSRAAIKIDADRGVVHTDMFRLMPDKYNPNDQFKWVTVKPGGYKPLPRSSVSCTMAPNAKVYCFGGVKDIDEDEEDIKEQFGEDLLALDLTALTWRLLEITKKEKRVVQKTDETVVQDVEMEAATSSTTTVHTDGIFTVTVGGAPTSSGSYKSLPKVPSLFPNRRPKNVPSPRMNSGLCVCKGTLYVYGGIFQEDSKQYTFNDFYALYLHKLDEWKAIIPNNMDAHEWIDSESSDSDSAVIALVTIRY